MGETDSKINLERQRKLKTLNNCENEQSWRTYMTGFQDILESSSKTVWYQTVT